MSGSHNAPAPMRYDLRTLPERVAALEAGFTDLLTAVAAMTDEEAAAALRNGGPVTHPVAPVSRNLEERLQAIETALQRHADWMQARELQRYIEAWP